MQKIKLIISFLSEKSKKIFGKIFPNNKLTNDNYLESSEEGKTTNNITPIDLSYSATYDTAVLYPETIIYNSQNDKTRITIGNDSHVRATLLIYPYGGEIRIGKNCYIGDTTRIWSAASVVIGNDVMISHNVNIIDTNSHETDPYERAVNSRKARLLGLPKVQGNVPSAPILIEDYVWINFNVVILKGVTIGEGAIIAAGAIVTKDVPAFSVVAGNPAKVVKVIKKSNQFKDLL